MSVRAILAILALPLLGLAACSDTGETGAANAAPQAAAAPSGSAPAATDWTKTVVATPEGGYRIGNPDAKVKLVEFASYTCGACKQFYDMSEKGGLKTNYVRSGRVSFEYRPFMLNVYDFAAVMLAFCETPQRAVALSGELFANHDLWVTPFTKLSEADIAPLRNLPADRQIRALAELGGFHNFARARGVPKAKFDQCLSNQAGLDKRLAAQQAAQTKFDIKGTPTFLINGRKVEGTSWPQIESQLKAALR